MSERMFTFSTSSEKPTYRVRCHNCPWEASGNARKVGGEWINPVFRQAGEHVCPGESAGAYHAFLYREGLSDDERRWARAAVYDTTKRIIRERADG